MICFIKCRFELLNVVSESHWDTMRFRWGEHHTYESNTRLLFVHDTCFFATAFEPTTFSDPHTPKYRVKNFIPYHQFVSTIVFLRARLFDSINTGALWKCTQSSSGAWLVELRRIMDIQIYVLLYDLNFDFSYYISIIGFPVYNTSIVTLFAKNYNLFLLFIELWNFEQDLRICDLCDVINNRGTALSSKM